MFRRIAAHYIALSGTSKRGFWIALVITLCLFTFAGYTLPELLVARNAQGILANGFPIFLGLCSGLSVVLFWFGRPKAGGWTLIGSLLVGMLAVPLLAEGLGFVAAVFAFGCVSLVAGQTLPKRDRIIVNLLIALVAVGIVILDIYYPGDRIAPDEQDIQAAAILASIMLVVIGIVTIRQFRNYSMRTKLVFIFVGTTIIVAGGITAYTIYNTRELHINKVGGTLSKLAQSQGMSVGDVIDKEIKNITVLCLDSTVSKSITKFGDEYPEHTAVDREKIIKDMIATFDQEWRVAYTENDTRSLRVFTRLSWSVLTRKLNTFKANFPDHLDLMITDKYGALMSSTFFPQKYDHSDEVWWQTAYSGGLGSIFISQPFFDEINQEYAVGIAVPVQEMGSTEIIGVLYTKYRIEAFRNVLFGENIVGSTSAELIIPGDIPTIVREGELVPIEPEIVGKLKQLRRQQAEDYAEIEFMEEPSFASLAPVNLNSDNPDVESAVRNLNWSIMVSEPMDIVTTQIDNQVDTTLVITLVFAGLVSILSIILAQYLTGPLSRLTMTTERFAEGHYDIRAQVEMSDEIGALSSSFNTMASEIQETLEGLEQQILSRTRAIALSAEVSRRIVTILDLNEIASEVVTRLQESFGYYHVQIYLMDESEKNLILVGGTGDAGRILLDQDHSIPYGKGLVWSAIGNQETVNVSNTRSNPEWLPNPMLPDTMSEIALPIIFGDVALGVLDIQQDFENAFTDQDVKILTSIANQMAVALRNAIQYNRALSIAKKEASLQKITSRIQTTRSMHKALQVSIRELGHILPIKRTAVWVNEAIMSYFDHS